jgi:hypothetical protein
MKKDELIAKLNEIEGNPEVWIRTWEQHAETASVSLITNKKEERYDQGDAPSYDNEDVFPYILITDNN